MVRAPAKRCAFCRSPIDSGAPSIKYHRGRHRVCLACRQRVLPPTPVGGIVGNLAEGLYRIVARVSCIPPS